MISSRLKDNIDWVKKSFAVVALPTFFVMSETGLMFMRALMLQE
jgi:hypothetical protein